MSLSISEVEGQGVGNKGDKDIQIRFSGEDIKFVATEYSIAIYINEDEADKISFQLSSLLQDREIRKKNLDK